MDDSFSKVLATPAWGPEFRFPAPRTKAKTSDVHLQSQQKDPGSFLSWCVTQIVKLHVPFMILFQKKK